MIPFCFTSHSNILHSFGDVTIASEGLLNLGLYLALVPGFFPAVTQGLGVSGLLRRTDPFMRTVRQAEGTKDLFLPKSQREYDQMKVQSETEIK